MSELKKIANDVLAAKEKSTSVVSWYAHKHEGQVRGPYQRWLQVSEVSPEYRKYVSESGDDAEYEALVMNDAPALARAVLILEEAIQDQVYLSMQGGSIDEAALRLALTKANEEIK